MRRTGRDNAPTRFGLVLCDLTVPLRSWDQHLRVEERERIRIVWRERGGWEETELNNRSGLIGHVAGSYGRFPIFSFIFLFVNQLVLFINCV